MPKQLEAATPKDATEIALLRSLVALDLETKFGPGPWAGASSERSVLFGLRQGRIFMLKRRNRIVASLALGTKKPWSIDRKYFSPSLRPFYLTSMAVLPDFQRKGIGAQCMENARELVRRLSGDAIRLDAYNTAAGAGEFYRKCGFREVGRASFRNVPLIYFEMLV